MTTLTRRGAAARASLAGEPRIPRWMRRILGIPLELKLLGANVIILAAAGVVLFSPIAPNPGRAADISIIIAALGVGALVNFALVKLALQPVHTLERVASSVSAGRLAERVPASLLPRPGATQLSHTITPMPRT